MTVPTTQGVAIEVARSLSEVDGALRGLGFILIIVSAIGIALAIGVGLLIARGVIGPVERLTAAAEHVATTEDFSTLIDVDRTDELGRLAASFNAMLVTVQRSQRQQQQLVMDASHEMRTPLTVLRTNIEQLARDTAMPTEERRARARRPRRRGRRLLRDGGRAGRPRDRPHGRRTGRGAARPHRRPGRRAAATARARTRGDRRLVTVHGARRPELDRARVRERPRQRAQVEPARRPDRGARSPTVCSRCATTVPASTTTTSRTCSNASTARPPRGRCPAPASVLRSSTRSRARTTARSPSPAPTAAAPSSPSRLLTPHGRQVLTPRPRF